ncbi:MAG: polysaccharide export protein [Acidobacteriota bacterium]|nr:polysaccharide export protein [Acidobacteriota bacterium]
MKTSMKTLNKCVVMVLVAVVLATPATSVMGQTPDNAASKTRQRFATQKPEPVQGVEQDGTTSKPSAEKSVSTKKGKTSAGEAEEPRVANADTETDKSASPGPVVVPASDVPEATHANRHEQTSEEADIVPYYNNFFNTYRLGPEDIVSVSVFGQDRYSRSGIIIPPSGRISLALIPGGVFVNGKTVDEVAETIKKRYDEYIIDPQVSVSLDKASSYRYSVIGDVAQPGIRLMNRRLTVTEALSEAGGVLQTGDRSRVVVLRKQADGNLKPIGVNVSAIYKGKAPDVTYLVPGDQVIVPGNKLKSFQKIMSFIPILSFARIFTGGVFP